jgi:ABC-type lipoprotein release transport system permease subunit
LRFRAELRRRWPGMIGIAVLVGIAGGAVLTAVAGARRTDTTIERTARVERSADVLVNPDESDDSEAFARRWAAVDRLPEVRDVATVNGVPAVALDEHGNPDFSSLDAVALVGVDNRFLYEMERPRLLRGRLPARDRPFEMLANERQVRTGGTDVGGRLRLGMYDFRDFEADRNGPPPKPRLDHAFTVVGVVTTLDDAIRANDDPNANPTILFSPSLAPLLADVAVPYVAKFVRLQAGADLGAFESGTQRVLGGNVNFQERQLTEARARRTVRPYVLALWLFAAAAALAALAVVGQAIGRGLRPLRDQGPQLMALGFTRAQLTSTAALRGVVVGVLGMAIAVALAVAASPLMPIGPLRRVEPDRGMDVDAFVLVLGAVAIVLGCVAGSVLALRRRRRQRGRLPSTFSDEVARTGAPVPVVSGIRFALDRGRDGTVPLWSTVVGITVAIAALVATVVYGSGLTRFTSTPQRYGWVWDGVIQVDDEEVSPAAVAGALATSEHVTAFAPAHLSQFEIRGHSVAAIGVGPGVRFLPLLDGRTPRADDELVLGATTLRNLGLHLGDRIDVRAQEGARTFTIVGTAVFARFAPYSGSEPTGLGIGAATTANAIESLHAELGTDFFVVQLRSGSPDTAEGLLGDEFSGDPAPVRMLGPQRPNDVLSYDRLQRTPLVLAGLLVVLAFGSAVHLLVSGVRSRRQELALLKTMGLTRAQTLQSVLAQATTLVALTLVVALPVGVIGGRWLWMLTAHWLGIADDPAVPVLAIGAIALVSVVVANLIALGPATTASRLRPAIALRAE